MTATARARAWLRTNLFSSLFNSLLSLVLVVVLAVLIARTTHWVFATADWEPVRRNLTLFMQGTFERDEQWRLVVSTLLIAAAVGMVGGVLTGNARDNAAETGEPLQRVTFRDLLRRFWPLLAFVVLLLLLADTARPWVFALVTIAVGAATRFAFATLPRSARGAAWVMVGLTGFASFHVISGTGGRAWLGPGIVLAVAGSRIADRLAATRPPRVQLAARVTGASSGLAASFAVYQLPFMDFGGVGWSDWSGFHLTLFATAVSITLAFPVGLLLALGRRSSFPVFRWLSITYIEFIRGVPLITLLLAARFFIGFFLASSTGVDLITRAIIAMTMFTGAYIAEIVRGGLQAVPKGQIEAGQAIGLSAPKVTRLIVLPQALRAVIPAMVGQFISLFKDTSLLVIIGVTDFLAVRGLVHAQTDFRVGFQEMTLVFIAAGYWAVAYTMSRESQRLERRLGVGDR